MSSKESDTPTRQRQIGAWIVERRLSIGGSSEIFLAHHADRVEERAVVKLLLPHLAEDPRAVMAFEAEAELLAQIASPLVVALYDAGTWLGAPWLALEYVAGLDLANVYKEHQGVGLVGPSLGALGLLGARALAAAHATCDASGRPLGVVHRDISPQNFVLDHAGTLKLIDFGTAQQAGARGLTETGVIKGKHAYMSPEQVREEPLDARSDLFSLGVVLWELATGRRLFQRDSVVATLEAVVAAEIEPIATHQPAIHPPVAAVITSCLAASPEDRPPSARILADRLVDALQDAWPDVRWKVDSEVTARLAGLAAKTRRRP